MSKYRNLRTPAILLSAALLVSGASGCSQSASAAEFSSDRLSIVCTIFPEYDWVKCIMGDKAADADITYLLDNGIDLHNYSPSSDDIIKISGCDLFLYVGGESDEWVEDAVANAVNKDMKTVCLLDAVGDRAKVEELKEGMQSDEHDHDHDHGDEEHEHDDEAHDHDEDHDEDHDHDHDHDHGDEPEYDEHVWLSVKNARLICAEIADKLCVLDPDNAASYKANLASYTEQLDALDKDFEELTASAANKTLIFGDRFPFRYFTEDYGLDYYAAFIGCSAETEASFETIVFLSGKADELGCKTIYTIEGSDKSIANTVINSTTSKDQTIAELNSLQSVSRAQADSGTGYIQIMRGNYDVLKNTLK